MSINLDTRSVKSPATTEFYISAAPIENTPLHNQAREIFSGIHKILRSKAASILQERVFLTQNVTETVSRIRSKEYGDIDDKVAPSFLVGAEGTLG